jgi:DNA-binding PadR family transcriptional regulator
MHSNPDLDRALTPHTYYILLALYDQPRHGYAIMEQVVGDSKGTVIVASPTLYRALSRLLKEKLIEEYTARPHLAPGKDRRYYRITKLGKIRFEHEVLRLKRAALLGHQQLHGPTAWRTLNVIE